jgi:DHA1 family bicyclomycin/chloramphenicol resistance-like MFS transporter
MSLPRRSLPAAAGPAPGGVLSAREPSPSPVHADNAGFTRRGLIWFLAMSMALTALGIDLLLPAFPAMRADLGLPAGSTAITGVVTTFFVGLALGQIVMGTVSDSVGRRPVLVVGVLLYVVGAVLAAFAPSLPLLLAARFIWGIGAAAGRVLAMAIIRDRFAGGAMARMLSLVMAVFVIVPVIAPSIGAVALRFMEWRLLIGLNVIVALAVLAMILVRLEETLPIERRRPLRFRLVATAVRRIATDPRSGPTVLAQAVLFGAFASYLTTSEVIIGDVFGRPAAFPLVFGAIALLAGTGSLVNGRLVERIGVPRMVRTALATYLVGAAALVLLAQRTGGRPPMLAWLAILVVVIVSHATLIPNLTSLAMAPMGDIAGIASAVVGSVLIGGGGLLGSAFDRTFDGTVTPLSLAFLGCGATVLVLVGLGERSARRRDTAAPVPPVAPVAPVIPTV